MTKNILKTIMIVSLLGGVALGIGLHGIGKADAVALPEEVLSNESLKEEARQFRAQEREFASEENALKEMAVQLRGATGFNDRKQILITIVDRLIRHAQILEERIVDYPVIRNELEQSMIEDLRQDTRLLTRAKNRLEQAGTMAELKNIVNEMRNHRGDFIQKKQHVIITAAHLGQLGHHFVVVENEKAEKLQAHIMILEGRGRDVSDLREKLNRTRDLIGRADQYIDDMKVATNRKSLDEVQLSEVKGILKNVKKGLLAINRALNEVAQGIEDMR